MPLDEILTKMVENEADISRQLINLLQVLCNKKILNCEDLIYIRDYGKEHINEEH